MSKHYIIPVFVPHFGCPNDCVFCNQRKITGLSTNLTEEDAEEVIVSHLNSFKKDAFTEIAFYGGSFTAIDFEIQEKLLKVAFKYKRARKVDEIRLSTRPDAINDSILSMLKEYSVDTIELGVQSLDNQVLAESDRGHFASHVYDSAKLIKSYGFNLGLQMMVGLPGDTLDKSIHTARGFIRLEPQCVRIYPTLVIKNTDLEKNYLNGSYKPLSLDEAIEQCSILLMMFKLHDINVIRVGLQPTENIQLGGDVVAGPFHPAFRQLVEADIVKTILSDYFKSKGLPTTGKSLILQANGRNISNIAGQKSSNIKYFKSQYGFKKIRLYETDMDEEYIDISIDTFKDKIDLYKDMKKFL